MNVLDCIVIGGGPAGLSASLTLGRSRRTIALFDDKTNSNRVTQEAHGFITRDGIKPQELKELGLKELANYPSITYVQATVIEIIKNQANDRFIVKGSNNQEYVAEKIILAYGIQEAFSLPSITEC